MGFAYNFDSLAHVLTNAEPVTYKGSWNVIKGGLIEAGEISESGGVVQKVISITRGATAGETAGETVSALCAMNVSESVVAGEAVTTLTPTAAVTFTPKVVALCAIAAVLGLDLGVRLGNNLINLYYGEDWDWHAPGLYDLAKDAIRTYVKADGTTYYDDETIKAFGNRLNEIGAFNEGNIFNKPIPKNIGWAINNGVPLNTVISNWNAVSDSTKQALLTLANHFNIGNTSNIYKISTQYGSMTITTYNSNEFYLGSYHNLYSYEPNEDFENNFPSDYWFGYFSTNGREYPIPIKTELGSDVYTAEYKNGTVTKFNHIHYSSTKLFNEENGVYFTIYAQMTDEYITTNLGLGTTGAGIEGVTKQDGATVPNKFPLEIPNTYPNWLPHPITSPDVETITYPVEMPDVNPSAEKATKPQKEAQTGKNNNPSENPVIDKAINKVPEVNPDLEPEKAPTKDNGKTPKPELPFVEGIGTGFTSIYNPSMSVLARFSQFLWSNNFLDNVKKLFANPMDAIIGLHMLYVTPTRGEQSNIVCGYVDSNILSNTVSNQYVEKSFGSIKINRYYNNILDYAPYTKVQIYLPYIGIVDLDVNDIMNGTLTVKYRIDVLTGTCLARLIVKRGDYEAELYNFAGNCAIQLPISGGSYSSIIANSIGIAGSIGATVATGGALAPVLVGSVVSAVTNSHVNVSHSGTIGSNAGAMGVNNAYLIITRPKPHEAKNYNEFYGKPSNKTVTLSSCSGYTRVKDVHIDNIVATDNELSMIEELLKSGVII